MNVGEEVSISCRVKPDIPVSQDLFDHVKCNGKRATIHAIVRREAFGMSGGASVSYRCLDCKRVFSIQT